MSLQNVISSVESSGCNRTLIALMKCVVTLASLALLMQIWGFSSSARAEPGTIDFALVDHRGMPVSPQTLRGKPSLLFFGFTHCPDICPTTLQEIGSLLDGLGQDAGQLNVMFVTLDPERDSQEHLANYLSSFDSRIMGVTGERADIEKLAQSVDVTYERVVQSGGYSFDHSIFSFLLDVAARPNGRMLIGHGAPLEIAVKRLRNLIARSQGLHGQSPLAHKARD